ncbi:MAG: RyR domain-containing protein [Pirellulaceae bacterium]
MPYHPQPLDTAHVTIPPTLESLLEKLAVNVHDIWADQRLRDGWKYGPARDDAKQEHPCLRPFHELPAAEQEYDRRVVRDTLRAMLAMGYRIEK